MLPSSALPYCMYLRKSRTDLEAEAHGEGETLARHEKMLLDLARRGNYNVTEIYREVVSGETIAARPVVQKLLQEVADGLWAGVLVVEVERLARGDTIDQGVVAQTFKYSGTKIVTPLKVYDPENEMDEEYFEFGLFMSRREYKTINRRLQRGRLSSVREGKWVSGRAPFGYERVRVPNDKGWTLRPVEDKAEIVRMIFQLYVVGEDDGSGEMKRLGTHTIALRLDALGVPSPGNAPCWNAQGVLHILKNPAYIGQVRWNECKTQRRLVNGVVTIGRYVSAPEEKIYAEGLHPAIVEKELFLKAQELVQQKGVTPVPSSYPVANPLAGLMVCGLCGRHIVLRRHRNKGDVGQLVCPNRLCKNVSAKYNVVEQRLLQGLSQWLAGYRLSWSDDPPADEAAAIALKEKSIKKARSEVETLRKQLASTHDLLEQGVYDTETFLQRSRAISERIQSVLDSSAALSAELEREEARAASRKNIIPKVEELLAVYATLPTAQAKNEMLKGVLEKVEYTRLVRGRYHGPFDNFDLVLYPKLPSGPV